MDHLILGCVLSRQLWFEVLRRLNLDLLIMPVEEDVFLWWSCARKIVPKAARPGFDSLFFLLGWTIWKERNDRTFGGQGKQPAQLLHQLIEEAKEWLLAGYRKLGTLSALL